LLTKAKKRGIRNFIKREATEEINEALENGW
jgi:hypothetical protein